jgi:hypothetical protein
MTLTIPIALMSAFREAQDDEILMILFGSYSPECVERGILRSLYTRSCIVAPSETAIGLAGKS